MIRQFLTGLPYAVTQPMFREYESKCSELEGWRVHSSRSDMAGYLNQAGAIHLVFALGIYYRYVVAPFGGSAEFFARVRRKSGAGLRLGGESLDPQLMASIGSAVRQFEAMAQSFGLDRSLLSLTDVKSIVPELKAREEARRHGQQ